MARSRLAFCSHVVLIGGALVASPAQAVDPSLHALPDRAFQEAIRAERNLVALQRGETDGIEVQDIRDLGVKPPAPAEQQPVDLWDRIRRGFAMPDLDSPLVVERQAWYAERPHQIDIMVERSRRYLFHIVEELEKRDMPTELALLPMVESAFNPMAYSRSHASGLWQFIPSTGRQYNLEQNFWYDGRRDIIASTSAALDYLQFLYQLHGDWHLALASYNWGENAVLRAVQRNRDRGLPTNYASLAMPGETRNYVPKLQALKNIVANPSAFGVDLAPIPNAEYFVTVTLTRDIDLRVAAKLAEMNVDELVALNPGHNRPVVSIAVAPQLVLPADRAEAFVRNLRQHDRPLSSWTTYTYKTGDRLEKIAADHGTTLAKLRAANGLGPRSKLQPGQQLIVPVRGSAAAADPLPPVFTQTANAPRSITYVVKRGDTVYGVARALGVSQQDVQRAAGPKLVAGRTITLSTAVASTAKPSGRAAAKAPQKGKVAKPAPARPAPTPTQLARPSSAS